MKTISHQHFRVSGFENLEHFYCNLLGMDAFESHPGMKEFGYSDNGCHLCFHRQQVEPFLAQPNDFYWKVGVTLRDLDVAVEHLREGGLTVSDPHQFRDIGYMSKITDPNGFTIELLQQSFEGSTLPVGTGHPIGSQAIMAHITLRVTDIASARRYFEKDLGMRLMSMQSVGEFSFTLYFYSWSEEPLPNPDLEAVGNREWLWARPYAFIELQHLEGPDATTCKTPSRSAGFDGFSYLEAPGGQPVFIPVAELNGLS